MLSQSKELHTVLRSVFGLASVILTTGDAVFNAQNNIAFTGTGSNVPTSVRQNEAEEKPTSSH